MNREYVCYYCKEKVKAEELIEWENEEKKKFRGHKNCRNEFIARQKNKEEVRKTRLKEKQENKELWENESKELDKVYRYLQDILKFNKPLGKQNVLLIQNLRAGQSVKNGTKIFLNKEGYPYEVILLTMKAKRQNIDNALKYKLSNSDMNAKVRYIMAIIGNSIPDIYSRWENRQNQQEKVIQMTTDIPEMTKETEYIPTEKKKNEELNDLW